MDVYNTKIPRIHHRKIHQHQVSHHPAYNEAKNITIHRKRLSIKANPETHKQINTIVGKVWVSSKETIVKDVVISL